MSSTNRGAVRETSDFYVTPIPAVRLFLLEWFKDSSAPVTSVRAVLDPCAGGIIEPDGRCVVPMSYPAAIAGLPGTEGWTVRTLDIRKDSLAATKMDFLDGPYEGHDLIIGNPPFALAPQFISKALADVNRAGFVVMLLRLNFFGSDKRKAWLQGNMPTACYVHADRMKFNLHRMDLTPAKRRATDSIEYAHFVWQKGVCPRFTNLRII